MIFVNRYCQTIARNTKIEGHIISSTGGGMIWSRYDGQLLRWLAINSQIGEQKSQKFNN
jgi:hypothetical protein